MRTALALFFSGLVLVSPEGSAHARVVPAGCRLRPAPVVSGERSAFTAGDGPDHAFFSIRNPGRTPMHFELDGLFVLAPERRALTVERILIEPANEIEGRAFDVAPRETARLVVFFEPLSGRSPFEISATFRREGCPFIATARVSWATRHPVEP